MSETPSNEIRWAKSASTDSQPIIKVGVWSIGVVFLLFLIWGAVFELSSAVITPGTLVSEGKNKLIQHPIGGRVKEVNGWKKDRSFWKSIRHRFRPIFQNSMHAKRLFLH